MMVYSRGDAAGDQKAPRHEIAVGHAGRCRERYGDLAAATGLMSLDWRGLGTRFAGAHGDCRAGAGLGSDVCGARARKINDLARVRTLPFERRRERLVRGWWSIDGEAIMRCRS